MTRRRPSATLPDMPTPLPSTSQVEKKTQQLLDYINVKGHTPDEILPLLDVVAKVFNAGQEVVKKQLGEEVEMLLIARRQGKLTIKP